MSLALAFAPAFRPFRATRLRLVRSAQEGGPAEDDGASVSARLALAVSVDSGARVWAGRQDAAQAEARAALGRPFAPAPPMWTPV